MFAARNVNVDELAQQAQLIRFAQLTLMTAGALRTAALRLERPGRNPRHFDIGLTTSTTASPGYWPASTAPSSIRT